MTTRLIEAWLLLGLFACIQTATVDESLSDYLWRETSSLRQDALHSVFVQGLQNLSLDPTDFGGYMVQDIAYMYLSKKSIDTAASRTSDLDLKQFLEQTAHSYESLYVSMFKEWHIEDISGIKLGDACSNYSNHLSNVSNNLEPIYIVAAILPCVKLWPWIGEEIGVEKAQFGVYTKWAKENFDPNYKGYKVYEFMINTAFKEGTVEKDLALTVFNQSMKGEVDFFNLL